MTEYKRIIKFRGKPVLGGDFVYGSLVQATDGVFIIEEGAVMQFQEPDYHTQGMGCGLEDRGITDRYEAMQHGHDCAVEKSKELHPNLIEVNPETVGQLCGVPDKSEKEIYDGDIVNYMFDYDDEKLKKKAKRYTGKVYWEAETAGWVVGPDRLIFNGGHFCQIEVIGNIYDNPELIADEN